LVKAILIRMDSNTLWQVFYCNGYRRSNLKFS
jgi:hypothetical protein